MLENSLPPVLPRTRFVLASITASTEYRGYSMDPFELALTIKFLNPSALDFGQIPGLNRGGPVYQWKNALALFSPANVSVKENKASRGVAQHLTAIYAQSFCLFEPQRRCLRTHNAFENVRMFFPVSVGQRSSPAYSSKVGNQCADMCDRQRTFAWRKMIHL